MPETHLNIDSRVVTDLSALEEVAPSPQPPPPFPPVVPGPSPEIFDCRSQDDPVPDRLSPHPLSCILDVNCKADLVVGHRGAGGELGTVAPENSLEGIRAAIWMGLDGVELDIRHTADDVLVLMHDSTVDRSTQGTGKVSDLPASEVIGLPLVLPGKSTVEGDFSCSVVAPLSEALELTRDRLFVDLDTKTDRIDLVVAEIEKAGLVDQVFISVSDYQKAVEARALNANIRIQVRPDTPEEFQLILEALERPPEIVEIPVTQIASMSESIHAIGAKVFTDAWAADAHAYIEGNFDKYIALFEDGADVAQSELVPLLLKSLGRWNFDDQGVSTSEE